MRGDVLEPLEVRVHCCGGVGGWLVGRVLVCFVWEGACVQILRGLGCDVPVEELCWVGGDGVLVIFGVGGLGLFCVFCGGMGWDPRDVLFEFLIELLEVGVGGLGEFVAGAGEGGEHWFDEVFACAVEACP